jgi:hypothetical protein
MSELSGNQANKFARRMLANENHSQSIKLNGGLKMNETIEVDGIKYVRQDSIQPLTEAKSLKGMKYMLIRTQSAGVFVGYMKSKKDNEVVLLNARRLWYWDGASSLSQLAMEGVKKPDTCKFPCEVSEVTLLNVIEIISVTEKAKQSISEVKIWKQ